RAQTGWYGQPLRRSAWTLSAPRRPLPFDVAARYSVDGRGHPSFAKEGNSQSCMDEVRIIPTLEQYIERFHAAVDVVARERRYLAFLEAPPLESTRAFMRRLLADGGVQMFAVTPHDAVVG